MKNFVIRICRLGGRCLSTLFVACLAFFLSYWSSQAFGQSMSIAIANADSDKIITAIGDYQIRESPCSTFKIALSLMGFDARILKNNHEPALAFHDEYDAPIDSWRLIQTPQTWITRSCVWYSRAITAQLGMEKFQRYVYDFDYGNQDVSGTAGKHDGLTNSWLCSSLKISPSEQVLFIKKFLQTKLGVTDYAYEQTKKLLYLGMLQEDVALYGKTGTGMYDGTKSIGWFVGWFVNEKKHETQIFACLLTSYDKNNLVNGFLAKKRVMQVFDYDVAGTQPSTTTMYQA